MKKILLLASVAFGLVALGKGVQAVLDDAPAATVSYYGDGRPKNSTSYVDGVKQGRSEQWRSDGTKEWDGQYKDGLREGEWLFWREDGALDSERSGIYREGKRIEG
jgi:antitoxin component YwqK of YwqJK toxin-antitoxin module